MTDPSVDELLENNAVELPKSMSADYSDLQDALSREASIAWDPARGGLPLGIREIVAVAVIALLGYPDIGTHMRRALKAGSTIREITEALMTISTPGGQRCLAYGLPELAKLAEELGGEAEAVPTVLTTARTGRGLTPSGDWPWLDQHYPEYQAVRRELSRLAFVPENAVLETKYREILAAVVLSCRRYFTVPDHARRAIEEGATLEELVDAMYVGSLIGGAPVFSYALPFLTQIHDEIEAGTLGTPTG